MVSPIGFLIIFLFLPETPYYLLQKNKKAEALKSLLWLRKGRSTEEVEKELSLMQVRHNNIYHGHEMVTLEGHT